MHQGRGLRLSLAPTLALGLGAWAPPAHGADATMCAAETGFAFLGGRSAVAPASPPVWIFGSPDGATFCEPGLFDRVEATAEGRSAIVSYEAGTGIQMGTGAVAPGGSSAGGSRAYLKAGHLFVFRVERDGALPGETATIMLTARHRSGAATMDASGAGSASNGFESFFSLRRLGVTGPEVSAPWSHGGFLMPAGAFVDVPRTLEVPVGEDLYFATSLNLSSDAFGSRSPSGSGAAAAGMTVTYEIEAEDDAEVVFAIQETLGLAPPRLDVVEAPGAGAFASWAAVGLGIACPSVFRRRPAGPRDQSSATGPWTFSL